MSEAKRLLQYFASEKKPQVKIYNNKKKTTTTTTTPTPTPTTTILALMCCAQCDKAAKYEFQSTMYPNSVERRKTIMNCFRDRAGSRKDLTDPQHYTEVSRKQRLSKSPSLKDIRQCDGSCVQKIQDMSRKIAFLEKQCADDKAYKKGLEGKVVELTKRLEESLTSTPERTRKNTSSTSRLVSRLKLSNWWKQRPTIDTLKRNNIFHNEPCFDTELELTLKHEMHTTIPKIVVDLVDLIEEQFKKSPHPVEGLYRTSGDYTKIQALRFSIDSNDYESLRKVTDIHTLTGLLKLFLREIKSPIIKTTEIKTFIGPSNQWLLKPMMKKIEILQNLVKMLPETNRDTLNYIFSHFHRLTKVPLQNVSSEVLAISITPSIFHTVTGEVRYQDIHIVLKESEVYADCLKLLIDHSSRIFEFEFGEHRRSRRRCRSFKRSLSQPCMMVSKALSFV